MATYVRYAHKAEKLELKMDTARDRTEIASNITAVTVLDKSTAAFTLTFVFYDGTELSLDNTEISNGDVFQWDIKRLLLTNTAQAGLTIKLLVDIQVEGR